MESKKERQIRQGPDCCIFMFHKTLWALSYCCFTNLGTQSCTRRHKKPQVKHSVVLWSVSFTQRQKHSQVVPVYISTCGGNFPWTLGVAHFSSKLVTWWSKVIFYCDFKVSWLLLMLNNLFPLPLDHLEIVFWSFRDFSTSYFKLSFFFSLIYRHYFIYVRNQFFRWIYVL